MTNDVEQKKQTTANTFDTRARSVFSHAPEILKTVNNIKPTKPSMVRYFKKYHELSDLPYNTFLAIKTSFSAGVSCGVSVDRFSPDFRIKNIIIENNPNPYIGIFAKYTLTRAGTGIILQSSLGYKNHHYSYTSVETGRKDYYETFIKGFANISRLGISVVPFSGRKINSFIEAGAMTCIYFNPAYDNYSDQLYISDKNVFSFHDNNVLNHNNLYGGFLRAGLTAILKHGNEIRLSAGYDGLKGSRYESLQSTDISIGYTMKLKK